jgi:F0F1-type ATP synthase assembly protein I
VPENQKSKIDKLLRDIEASRVKKSEYLKEKNIDPKTSKTIRLALRLSVEIIASLVVGVFMGLLIDHFFDTYPLGFILMFILGAVAGIWNVFKTLGLLETTGNKNINKSADKDTDKEV